MTPPRLPAKLNGFVEVTSGIVRVGPLAKQYDDPYEHFVAFAASDGKNAVAKGWRGKPPPLSVLRVAKQTLAKIGLTLHWTRSKVT